VDLPGAEVVGGQCRMQVLPPLPLDSPPLTASVLPDGSVELTWPRNAPWIGFQYELHRGAGPGFEPGEATYLGLTTAGKYTDAIPPAGEHCYALRVTSDLGRGTVSYAAVKVPLPPVPRAPQGVTLQTRPGEITLTWAATDQIGLRYRVYRRPGDAEAIQPLSAEPISQLAYVDVSVEPGLEYEYLVRSLDRRGRESDFSAPVRGVPLPLIREPVFVADLTADADGRRREGPPVRGTTRGKAAVRDGGLDLREGGHLVFAHLPEFEVGPALSVECWLRIDSPTQMPVILACGEFQRGGWFLQRYGRGWRWYLGGVSCDGGQPADGRWTHLLATFDGRRARLYQDGKPAAQVACQPNGQPWTGPLYVGQYGEGQRESYQVQGSIGGLKIYHRAVSAEEAAALAGQGRPGGKAERQ
jgi:hypothetical protein